MVTYTLNERAVARARELIDTRQYVLESNWQGAQPRADQEKRFSVLALVGGVRRVAPRPDRGCGRADEGALRLRVRGLPANPPNGPDRLPLPGRRASPQGDRARGARAAPVLRHQDWLSGSSGRAACSTGESNWPRTARALEPRSGSWHSARLCGALAGGCRPRRRLASRYSRRARIFAAATSSGERRRPSCRPSTRWRERISSPAADSQSVDRRRIYRSILEAGRREQQRADG